MPTSNSSYPMPAPVAEKVRRVQSRSMRVGLAATAVAGLAILLAAMGIAMAIDWAATLFHPGLRTALTIVALGVTAVTVGLWLVRSWRRESSVIHAAAAVDRSMPELEERWTTVAELARPDAPHQDLHPAMFRHVAGEASRFDAHVQPKQVVSLKPLTGAFIALNAVAVVLLLAAAIDSRRVGVLMRRFWSPTSPISATELTDVTGRVVAARGETVTLQASLGGEPVTEATLLLDGPSGSQEITLTPRGDAPARVTHRLRKIDQTMQYRLRAGDGQTDWYEVYVAERPEIAQVRLTVTPPEYTGKKTQTWKKFPARVSAVAGSQLQLALKPKGELAAAVIKLRSAPSRLLESTGDGWYRWRTTLNESIAFSPELTEPNGLTNHRPPTCRVSVYPDQPPVVRIVSPDNEIAVRPDDKLDVKFEAEDDFGVGAAELVIYGEPVEPGGEPEVLAVIPIDLGEQTGATRVAATAPLDLGQFDPEDGSAMSYEVRVSESRGLIDPAAAVRATRSDDDAPTAADPSTATAVAAEPSDSTEAPQSLASAAAAPSVQSGPARDQERSDEGQASDTPRRPAQDLAPAGQDDSAHSRAAESVATEQPDPATTVVQRSSADPADPSSDQRSVATAESIAQDAADGAGGMQPTPADSQRATAESQAAAGSTAPPNATSLSDASAAAGEQTAESERQSMVASNDPSSDYQQPPTTSQDDDVRSSVNRDMANGDTSDNEQREQTATAPPNPQDGQLGAGARPVSDMDGQPADPQNADNDTARRSNSGNSSLASSGSSQSRQQSPGDDMRRRMLDVAQAASSDRMNLRINKYVGDFEGRQRAKLEIAIAGRLGEIDKQLENAQQRLRSVLDELQVDHDWTAQHDRELDESGAALELASRGIGELKNSTYGTPYAFIGLQLAEVGLAHVNPAGKDLWQARQSEGDVRRESILSAWQHVTRAREMIGDLSRRFETVKRDHQLTRAVQEVERMYRVFIEDAMGLLGPDSDGTSAHQRQMAQFELDDEYLERLREVLQMREEMLAELARILADDPRLMRRFMDSFRNRADSLYVELTQIRQRQEMLNEDVARLSARPPVADDAGDEATDDARSRAQGVMDQLAEDAAALTRQASELDDQFEVWMPLNADLSSSDLVAAEQSLEQATVAGGKMQAGAAALQVAFAAADSSVAEAALQRLESHSGALHVAVVASQTSLLRVQPRADDAELADFVLRRMGDTRLLLADLERWQSQLAAIIEDRPGDAAALEQLQLADETNQLAGRLGDIESQLASLLERNDGQVPASIATQARRLLATLDKRAIPNQSAAAFAMRQEELGLAQLRGATAATALRAAEEAYDDLIAAAIEQLDKLPVQDPIAQALEDPTLDELMQLLEREQDLAEELGIPRRPTNLQVFRDLVRPGEPGGASGGGRSLMQMLQAQQRQMQRASRRAEQRARERMRRAAQVEREPRANRRAGDVETDWNVLVSELENGLLRGDGKLPPERYRTAIEQYFELINRTSRERTEPSAAATD